MKEGGERTLGKGVGGRQRWVHFRKQVATSQETEAGRPAGTHGKGAALGPVQFSRSVVCNSLRPHGLQHARPPCPPPTPRVYSNSCPLSRGCHPTILSSVVPFSSHFQSFPGSGRIFSNESVLTSGGQSIGVSASASVLPMNIQDDNILLYK